MTLSVGLKNLLGLQGFRSRLPYTYSLPHVFSGLQVLRCKNQAPRHIKVASMFYTLTVGKEKPLDS